jgi:RHS repeat-associated protein
VIKRGLIAGFMIAGGACCLDGETPASGAARAKAPAAKLALRGPATATPGSSVTFTVAVTATRRLPKGALTLYLSRDRRRDRRDVRLGRRATARLGARKTTRARLRVRIPARTRPRAYRALACLVVSRRQRCVARRLTIRARTTPGPSAPPPKPGPGPPVTTQPGPDPTTTPPPGDTPGAAQPVVVNTESPAPGPADAAAPDPATRATGLPGESTTSLRSATAFLYAGGDPIQKGMAAGTITTTRAAVVRGRVTTRVDSPIAGVRVTVLDHPEFGRTATRADGGYDLAVNGGGQLTLVFEREGYIAGQRHVEVPWQDYADVDPMVLVPYDDRGTRVDTGQGVVMAAQATAISDANGARTQTLLFQPGTTAQAIVGGAPQALGNVFTVRSTEFTVGTDPDVMPAQLPPTSQYTYAAEYSVDEAVALGASEVRFSRPVATFIDNFTGFPVGTDIPTGSYDRVTGEWVGAPNGRVIEVVAGGVDTDGDGSADNTGIDAGEQAKLAALYPVGKELWRVAVDHFTPWDHNFPAGPPSDANGPGDGTGPNGNGPPPCGPCGGKGSIVLPEVQMLGERLPITGAPDPLVYRSDDVPGRLVERSADVRLVAGTIPLSLRAVTASFSVGGRTQTITRTREEVVADPDHTFVWDGKDAYGRTVQGSRTAVVEIGYRYKAVFQEAKRSSSRRRADDGEPLGFRQSWARLSGVPLSVPSGFERGTFVLSKRYTTKVSSFDARGLGLAGWTLASHHRYDPESRTLRLGTGRFSGVEGTRLGGMSTLATPGVDGVSALAVDPTGALWLADTRNNRIRRRTPDGTLTTVAGTGAYGYRPGDDGGAATGAELSSPEAIAVVDAGGSTQEAYVADTGANRIRRVTAGGTITTVAGGGTTLGDDGPATSARLRSPGGVAVAPDGSLYIADTGANRIRMVGTDGIISTVAGTGTAGFGGDGGPASEAVLRGPTGLALTAEGDLLVSDTGNGRVRLIGRDGTIRTVAGGAAPADGTGDGGLATTARLREPTALAVGRDATVRVADGQAGRVRAFVVGGRIRTVAGGGSEPRTAGVPATAVSLPGVAGVVVEPDGTMLFSEPQADRVSAVDAPLPGFSDGDVLIGSDDGSQIYRFDANGRHEETLDALTGGVKRRFEYDDEGRLERVFDEKAGEATPHRPLLEIDRTTTPGSILLKARGATTTIEVDDNGWADAVTNPAGERHDLTHSADGLLTAEEDAEGGEHTFVHSGGRLVSDTGPTGVAQTLVGSDVAGGRQVTVTTSDGIVNFERGVFDADGTYTRTIVDDMGGTTVTRRLPDGTAESTFPDGRKVEERLAPDPRFGMHAAYVAERTVTAPSGSRSVTTMTRTVDPRDAVRIDGLVETIVSDGDQLVSSFSAGAGDSGGTQTATTPEGRVSTAILDRRGRVVSTRRSEGDEPQVSAYDDANDGRAATATQGNRGWTFGYDGRNRITSRTYANGETTTYTYDGADRLLTTTAGGQTWTLSYDDVGRRTGLTSPTGRVYGATHDLAGRITTMTLPGTPAAGRTYVQERLDVHTFASGATSQWLYKGVADGRRAAGREDRRAGSPTAVTTTGFDYVGDTGRVGTTSANSGTADQDVSYGYDGPFQTSMSYDGDADGTVTTPLDATLRRGATTITAGSGAPAVYGRTYDDDSQLASYGPFTISRDAVTQRADSVTDAADGTVVRSRSTEGFGYLDRRTVTESAVDVYDLQLSYDNVGRLASSTETVDGGAAVERHYAYDAFDRLRFVRDGAPDGAVVEEYTYNADGDRLTASGESATYDPVTHRQTAMGALAMSFDDDGFLTQRGADEFTYGPGGELLGVDRPAGSDDLSYTYDAYGRRTARAAGADRTTYLYGAAENDVELTASVDEAGVRTTYFYDQFKHLHAIERSGVRYRVGTDQVGTPRVVVNADGDVVKRIVRDTYGRLISDSAPAFELVVGFGGGIEDQDTGLVRMGARDYDPRTGRFTAEDPMSLSGSPGNLYLYAMGNPANQRDPSGTLNAGLNVMAGSYGGGVSVQAGWDGIGWCTEKGYGWGASAGGDVMGGPSDSKTAVSEQGASAVMGVTLASPTDPCPPKGIKGSPASAKFNAGPLSVNLDGGWPGLDDFNKGVGKVSFELISKEVVKDCEQWTFDEMGDDLSYMIDDIGHAWFD